MVIRQELEFLALNEERKDGYRRVATPHIAKEALYYRSRHLPYYGEGMYAPLDIDGENYRLRPMNCPHHHLIYGATRHSYRELPLRIAEYGQDYRYEASGGLSGLMRVRGFCMNDAHIYCRYDQAKDEFIRVMKLHARYYDLLDIKDYHMRLSLPDLGKLDKFVDEPQKWLDALAIIRQAMDGMPPGPWKADAPHVVLPDREKMKTQMEALIFHFKIVTEGFRVPEGEVFQVIESPRGELGYYVVSDGTTIPYRVHMRTPSFGNLQAVPKMVQGSLIADVIASIGSMDFVLGDTDR
jgi:hypothetical protein